MTKPEQIGPSIPPDGATVTPYGWAKFDASKWPKTKRQASEIEKRAAWALLTDIPVELRRLSGGDCGHVEAANELADICRQYLEAYDYAKSIGAIE